MIRGLVKKLTSPPSTLFHGLRMDLQLSTTALHGASTMEFFGDYAETRAALDYDYHCNYTPERQELQDKIIAGYLAGGNKCSAPWIVFTAGPMGAGKSHVIRWLLSRGDFPLDAFVLVDPDRVRWALPEMQSYVDFDRTTAGAKTNKESGYVCEIIVREALRQSKPVFVDGSLTQWEWYSEEFRRIRTNHPTYKIGIIRVFADKHAVFARAAARGKKTGRVVPDEVLLKAFKESPESFRRLAPLADWSMEVDNRGETPAIVSRNPDVPFTSIWECTSCKLSKEAGDADETSDQTQQNGVSEQNSAHACL